MSSIDRSNEKGLAGAGYWARPFWCCNFFCAARLTRLSQSSGVYLSAAEYRPARRLRRISWPLAQLGRKNGLTLHFRLPENLGLDGKHGPGGIPRRPLFGGRPYSVHHGAFFRVPTGEPIRTRYEIT